MDLQGPWAEYAQTQAASEVAASIKTSDANDVRLDRILDGFFLGKVETITGIERAVKSHARRERSRFKARRATEYAFMPSDTTNPDQTLIWKQAWLGFEETFSVSELRLLLKSEISATLTPMVGADRTKLSRIRSSAAYRTVRAEIFR